MEDWDAQKMLDKYIHDYMIRKNMHTAAEIFAEEANICPKPAAVNPPEGFLTEWWSLFWDVYSAKLPKHPEATRDSSNKNNVHSGLQRPDMTYMPPSVCPPLPMPRLPDFLQNVYSTITPRPDMVNMLQSALPTMISRPELNLNGLGLPPMLDTTIGQGKPATNWITENVPEQERLTLSSRDLNFNAQLINVDQLARLPPFSTKSRYHQKKVPQKPQRSLFINDRSRTYFGGSAAIKHVPHEALKLKQPKTEPDDAGRDKDSGHVSSGGWPSSQDSTSYSVGHSVGKQIFTNLGSCALVDDGIKGKKLQSGKTATSGEPLDAYIQSFFSNDEGPDDLSSSFCSSPRSSLSRGEFQPKDN